MTGIIIPSGSRALAEVEGLLAEAQATVEAAHAANTRRAYRSDWKVYETWCRTIGATPLPVIPEKAIAFITAQKRTCKLATLRRRVAALKTGNQAAGHPCFTADPRFRIFMRGVANTIGQPQVKKDPVLIEDLRRMLLVTSGNALHDKRNRALLLVGFSAALRRAELVAVDAEHLTVDRNGFRLTIPRSKTDQAGEGAVVGIPYGSAPHTCPVRAVHDWMDASGITSGALFRGIDKHGKLGERLTAQNVALVVKAFCRRAGIDPRSYAGHSLRAGLATASAKAGKSINVIMKQTRHVNVNTVLGYIRDATLFDDNAASGIGL